ncbi:MAG: C40 family peptidase [Azonexus sp.]|jgi:cell wall-associated NlpC family hydrolase|nr:C40 family peptidase [Azonexus sp.]
MRTFALLPMSLMVLLVAACSGPTPRPVSYWENISQPSAVSEKGNEVALYALGLIDTGYRFGGKNPEAGLDCSGMVSFIYGRAAGVKVKGSAADIARNSRPIEPEFLRPGDLVFFNTRNRPFSHVGIYLGDARFVHAPSSNGRVRIDRMNDRYYAQRFEAARTFFD